MVELVAAGAADDELRRELVRYWAAMGAARDEEWLARYWAMMESEAVASPPHRLLFWAQAYGQRVGFAMGRLVPDWLNPAHLTGYVAEVCVLRQYRRRGYGRQIATRLVAQLREAGAADVELDVLPANRGAMKFWARQGFRPAFVRFRSPSSGGKGPGRKPSGSP